MDFDDDVDVGSDGFANGGDTIDDSAVLKAINVLGRDASSDR